MIVGGGVYRERVDGVDYAEDLAGSGFRAATLLASAGVELVTAVETELSQMLQDTGQALGIDVSDGGRDRSVSFRYRAPFVEPALYGREAVLTSPLEISTEHALVFGIVEAGIRNIDADALVYDPQSTDDVLATGKNAPWRAPERLAICANAVETRALAGVADLEEAARVVADHLNADVVVTKAGGRGCLVTETRDARQTWVGAHPTETVNKIGSGDVFSASFAHAWISGADPIEAARLASATTAWWCGGYGTRMTGAALSGELPNSDSTALENDGRQPLIYLAGPFFSVEQRWMIDQCKVFLEGAGARVFSPIHEIGLGGPEVAVKDLEGLASCDAVFAVLAGWDPGTLFETGWATARGIPVVAVAGASDDEGLTMLVGTGAECHRDATTAMYRAIWRGLGA